MDIKKIKNISNSKKISDKDLSILKDLEKKVSWLSAWMIHNANNIRESQDGLKVGGHQASSASIISISDSKVKKNLIKWRIKQTRSVKKKPS